MMSEAIMTDRREPAITRSWAYYHKHIQAWGVAILFHLLAGFIFYKLNLSLASEKPTSETRIPARKIIQVQLISKPAKMTPQPEPAKLHSPPSNARSPVKEKPDFKKQRPVKIKRAENLHQMPPAKMPARDYPATRPTAEKPSAKEHYPPENKTSLPATPARLDSSYLSNPAPEYPSIARDNEQEGTVLLQVTVSVTGSVLQVKVHRSSGYTALDRAAVNAVRHWKFVPARTGNTVREADVIIPVNFSLEDA